MSRVRVRGRSTVPLIGCVAREGSVRSSARGGERQRQRHSRGATEATAIAAPITHAAAALLLHSDRPSLSLMWSALPRRAAAAAARPSSRRALHSAAATHDHVHSDACSHGAAASPPSVAAAAASASSASPSPSRPLPPVLAKGQLPPGDHARLQGWYQRPLPPTLIPFSSNRGKSLFKEALLSGGMEGYFALAEQFQTQSTPSLCGPGTLAMVLNALALDPKRLWKGNWRWFSEEMLESCDARRGPGDPLGGLDDVGLSFEEFLFMAECNGANVRAFRATADNNAAAAAASLARFRAAVHSATHRTDLHLVASFSRKVLGQTGSGHYSPVGGYHAREDLALVLDVARFKYPPYWAPVPLLWKAIQDVDQQTGQARGYYLMSKGKIAQTQQQQQTGAAASVHAAAVGSAVSASAPASAHPLAQAANIFTPLSSACRIAVDKDSWSRLAEHFCSVLPSHLQSQHDAGKFSVDASSSPADSSSLASLNASAGLVFREVLHSLPVELSSIFIMYTHDLNQRMVHAYQAKQQQQRAHEANNTDAGGDASAAATTDATASCNCAHSCTVHSPSSSPLSLYPTLLPKHSTAHTHRHTHLIPTVHALQPLLQAIAATDMFRVLSQAQIDLQRVEYKQRSSGKREAAATAASASAAGASPLIASASADSSATGGLGFHLLSGSNEGALELSALLLLAVPQQVFSMLPQPLQSRIAALMCLPQAAPKHAPAAAAAATSSSPLPSVLSVELSNLRSQMGILADFCLCGAAPSVRGNDNPNVDPRDVHDNEQRNRHIAVTEHTPANSQQHTRRTDSTNNERGATARTAASTPVSHRFVSGSRSQRGSASAATNAATGQNSGRSV